MANEEHLKIINQGVDAWSRWRGEHPDTVPDLSGAYLIGANLRKVNLSGANLAGADLNWADLIGANLSRANLDEANLSRANLDEANLSEADLRKADLSRAGLYKANLWRARLDGANLNEANLNRAILDEANLSGANLIGATLMDCGWSQSLAAFGPTTHEPAVNLSRANLSMARLDGANFMGSWFSEADLILVNLSRANLNRARLDGANLSGANLSGASLVETDLSGANLTHCRIYGVSAWGLKLEGTTQLNLLITPANESAITVDNLEIAQFIYLLLNNQKVREVIDTITSKVVLILGRFTEERKRVLDAIREELRRNNLTPILFDFEKPASKDTTGTVETLARMARFIIADLTDPSSIPHELATIVPFLRTTPVLPIKLVGSEGYSMFEDWQRQRSYKWVLDTYEYADGDSLISNLAKVIAPADGMAEELRRAR